MVLAYHLTFGAYGFWLPNDPRGSWSKYVGSRQLYEFGPATKTISRESQAHAEHDHQRRQAAKSALLFPPVVFSGEQARAVGNGFRHAVDEAGYHVYACAIMPDHVHLVVGRHERYVKRIISHFKAKASMELRGELWPYDESRPVWERGGWAVFLNDLNLIFNAIRYVEANPIREGLPAQRWSFVEPFEASSE
jgi:REP element-mobilizing transposase RayT